MTPLTVEHLPLEDVKLVRRPRHQDVRGFFEEIFTHDGYPALGLPATFAQINRSFSATLGTVRGLHYSTDPNGVGKLITVVRGSILDAAVDIRPDSPSFGASVAVELSEYEPVQVFVPPGFAHGFMTLEPNTDVIYMQTSRWDPAHDRGIYWNDPDLGIDWPTLAPVVLSDRDRALPGWSDVARVLRGAES